MIQIKNKIPLFIITGIFLLALLSFIFDSPGYNRFLDYIMLPSFLVALAWLGIFLHEAKSYPNLIKLFAIFALIVWTILDLNNGDAPRSSNNLIININNIIFCILILASFYKPKNLKKGYIFFAVRIAFYIYFVIYAAIFYKNKVITIDDQAERESHYFDTHYLYE